MKGTLLYKIPPEIDGNLWSTTLVKWSPDGKTLATNNLLIDADSGQVSDVFFDLGYPGYVDWHPSGQYLAIKYNQIYLYDVINHIQLADFDVGDPPDILCTEANTIDWHPMGKWLAATTDDGYVRIWQVFKN